MLFFSELNKINQWLGCFTKACYIFTFAKGFTLESKKPNTPNSTFGFKIGPCRPRSLFSQTMCLILSRISVGPLLSSSFFCYHSSIYNEDFSNFDINTKWIFEDKILFWDHSCLHTMQGHSSLGIIAAVPIRFRNSIDLHNKLGTHISSHLEIRPTKYHDLIGIIVLIPTYRLFNIID